MGMAATPSWPGPNERLAAAPPDLAFAGLSGRRLCLVRRAGSGHRRAEGRRPRHDGGLDRRHPPPWGLHTDAILVANACRDWNKPQALADLADLTLALTPARERWQETTITGNAFVLAAAAWPPAVAPVLPTPCPYPIAVGAMAGSHGIDTEDTVLAFLTAAVHSQVSVAVRLVPIGQSDGLAIMAALEPQIAALARHSAAAGTDAIGTIAYAADIAQMKHETLPTRIFRS